MKRVLFLEKRVVFWAIFGILAVSVFGCDSLRFAPSETLKTNAWLHNRTAQITVDRAKSDVSAGSVSPELVSLASLSEHQSRAFVADYGLPRELPVSDTVDDVLSPVNFALAEHAFAVSSERPGTWDIADGLLETGIAIAGVLGGVYGIRTGRFLRQTRDKTRALREIIEGNELFKRENTDATAAFKEAHKSQSPQTKAIVTQVKNG